MSLAGSGPALPPEGVPGIVPHRLCNHSNCWGKRFRPRRQTLEKSSQNQCFQELERQPQNKHTDLEGNTEITSEMGDPEHSCVTDEPGNVHPPPEKQSGRLSAKSGKKSDGPNSHMRQVCDIEEISVSHARHASTLKFWMKWAESQEKIYNYHKRTQEERESLRRPVISGEIPSLIKTKSSPKANSRPTGFMASPSET